MQSLRATLTTPESKVDEGIISLFEGYSQFFLRIAFGIKLAVFVGIFIMACVIGAESTQSSYLTEADLIRGASTQQFYVNATSSGDPAVKADASDDAKYSEEYAGGFVTLNLLSILGALYLGLFQCLLSASLEAPRWGSSRFARAGAEVIKLGVIVQILSFASNFAYWTVCAFARNDPTVAASKFAFMRLSGSPWIFFFLSVCVPVLKAAASLLLGLGIFLLESFHETGTSQVLAWLVLGFYAATGMFGMFSLVVRMPAYNEIWNFLRDICYFGALVSAFVWALLFEPVALEHAKPEIELQEAAGSGGAYDVSYGPIPGEPMMPNPLTPHNSFEEVQQRQQGALTASARTGSARGSMAAPGGLAVTPPLPPAPAE
uniref:Uncharacterized protein n=1 Tax=Chromera velia CCMP2878 TaxID=1169474 RepID=A0A0G4FXQ0_9ALVE|mmetsp:Transcript_9027/g.17658  ORF Transcript_9027/g.17658 Transcript_9027/m.17658 type:complete len:375 (+) Transcript_9027:189-1313(+)|eukprot:Cvel_3861.t1-p1 / transcript=Cvel_3861.t1 / gene=Cvel_3861 / organism=Chromera_velia_CCMP2878 / gene_product=hypothetical protein / transcript_product=hypothetical protein / location=Cvel_scaffold163:68509-73362(-) / protein_length=374 / sequence_SO=supercontig / SO=protein_coding / is_pseudo=false